jgi:hypothetical protein
MWFCLQPERLNGRVAMWAFAQFALTELSTHTPVLEQFAEVGGGQPRQWGHLFQRPGLSLVNSAQCHALHAGGAIKTAGRAGLRRNVHQCPAEPASTL